MVCDQPFRFSHMTNLSRNFRPCPSSITGLAAHPNNYSDSDIPWKFYTSKTASL